MKVGPSSILSDVLQHPCLEVQPHRLDTLCYITDYIRPASTETVLWSDLAPLTNTFNELQDLFSEDTETASGDTHTSKYTVNVDRKPQHTTHLPNN